MSKKLWISSCLGIAFVLLFVMTYWFYFSEPKPIPTNKQLVEEINSNFPEAAADSIQDTIPVDEHHVLVPFFSEKENYSLSYWVWQKREWKVASIDTTGQPKVWKIKKNDPSSYHVVWNIHPEDQLSSIDFYLIRDRDYYVLDGTENYFPRVQMEKKVSLEKGTYGLFPLPDDWVSFINAYKNVETAKLPNSLFQNFFPEQHMFFGWIPFNRADKEVFPERSVNGDEYYKEDIHKEHVMILNKEDIEKP
jgi:hypothetical protein